MIIDFHTHTFPENVAPKAVGNLAALSGITPFTNGTVDDTLRKTEKCNVDLCVCLNIATKPTQQASINNEAARINMEYKSLIAFGSVHPDAENSLDELHRIKKLGIKGIKLHPDYQRFMVNEERLYPIYDLCGKLDLIISMHTGWDCYSPDLIHAIPSECRKAALNFRNTKFVFAHMGGLKLWNDVEKNLVGLDNVYFDTAMSATLGLSPNQAERIIKAHPSDNVLLGSDCPWEDIRKSVNYVLSLNIREETKQAILYKNALKLLKISL